jgi:hypothetical protein
MNKLNPNYENFVRSFVNDDDFRMNISKPICFPNGWVATTNSYKLLWFYDPEFVNKENVFDHSKGEGVNALSVMEIFKDEYEGNKEPIGTIKLQDIVDVFSQIKTIPEYEDKYKTCSECDGTGEIECNCCEHISECKECDGEGEIKCGEDETGEYHFPTNHSIVINGLNFGLNQFNDMVNIFTSNGINELDVYESKETKMLFGVKGEKMFIIVMCIYGDEFEEKYNININ